jgi:hypothetical protein
VIGIDTKGLPSTQLNALKVTAATLNRALGVCNVTLTDTNGVAAVQTISGQDGADLFAALTSLKSVTLTTV